MKQALHILLLAFMLWIVGAIVGISIDGTYHISTLIATFVLYIGISSAIILNLNKHENVH